MFILCISGYKINVTLSICIFTSFFYLSLSHLMIIHNRDAVFANHHLAKHIGLFLVNKLFVI